MAEDTWSLLVVKLEVDFCPWKILVHKLPVLENWPVIHYLNRVPCETDNETAKEKDQVNLMYTLSSNCIKCFFSWGVSWDWDWSLQSGQSVPWYFVLTGHLGRSDVVGQSLYVNVLHSLHYILGSWKQSSRSQYYWDIVNIPTDIKGMKGVNVWLFFFFFDLSYLMVIFIYYSWNVLWIFVPLLIVS